MKGKISMAQITCTCGNVYEDTFKFCPECAAPNPNYGKSSNSDNIQNTNQGASPRKKFTRISSARNNVENASITPRKIPVVADNFNEDNDDYSETEDVSIESEYVPPVNNVRPQPKTVRNVYQPPEDEEDNEFEEESDLYNRQTYSSRTDYDEEYTDDEYDEDDEEYYEPKPSPKRRSPISISSSHMTRKKGKINKTPVLGSPYDSGDDYEDDYEDYEPSPAPRARKSKNTERINKKNNKRKSYDPNHDGYYDDRLPAILDEVTKTSHLDVILKVALAVVCLAGLITYCIFYVQV